MVNKKDTAILGVAITLIACYIGSKLWKYEKKTDKTAYNKGLVAFKEKEWDIALTLFLSIPDPCFDTFYMIAQCYINLNNSISALKYLDKCISIAREEKNSKNSSFTEMGNGQPLIEIAKLRFQIHNSLGMSRESFKDLFLINLINNSNENKEKANEFLKKLCLNLSKSHKMEGTPSPINYTDLFDTFLFLKDEQDPAIVFINSREFEKCFEYVLESEKPLHRFILGSLYLCNGDQQSAIDIFNELDFHYSKILIKFIKAKRLTTEEIEQLKDKMKMEQDPTILLYLSKIFESVGDIKNQFEALQNCISIFSNAPAYCSLAVMYIKQKNHGKASALIRSALKEFPESVNLVCIALEYFLLIKEIEEATKVMEMSEKLFPNDPRLFLFKYMISEVLGKPNIGYLERGIELDPKYYKLYVYYGNVCSSGEESQKSYEKALSCARTFDEVFAAYQLLVVVETQNELFKEFPNLFSH